MPYDAASIFGDKRDRKRIICSQGAYDELLRLMAVRMREKSTSSHLLNWIFVCRCFWADSYRHSH